MFALAAPFMLLRLRVLMVNLPTRKVARTIDEQRSVWMRRSNRYLLQCAIMLAAYLIAGKLGQATIHIRSSNLGPVWPAYGVALAGIVLCGYRVWPALMAAAFIVAYSSPVSAPTALGQAGAATAAAMAGAFLLNRVGFSSSMARLRDAIWFVTIGAFGSALISASFGTLALYDSHITTYVGLASGWLIYWLGDSTGALLITPLLFTVRDFSKFRDGRTAAEFASLVLFVMAVTLSIFGNHLHFPVDMHLFPFAVLPFVMWSAIRMGTAITSLTVLVVATVATVETALGRGPFTPGTPFMQSVLLDIFFAIISVSGLVLAVVTTERTEAQLSREQWVREDAAKAVRLRLASIIESSDDAIIGVGLDSAITDWNKGAELLFGYSPADARGQPATILLAEEASKELRSLLNNLLQMAPINRYDTPCQKKDGSYFEAGVRVSPILDTSGQICGGSVIVRDITLRKRQEAILRESETRFQLVADTAPVLIWMSGVDNLRTYFNKPWLEFTGRTFESQLGNGWSEGVHPEDLRRCVTTYVECFDRRETFRMEYRLRKADGVYRWVVDYGVPRFNQDGSFAGYIGSCIDITDSKAAEEAMSTMSRKLVAVQEKERTRIARELHDDINQRLALLAFEMHELLKSDPGQIMPIISKVVEEIGQLSRDIQEISHDLHSSKLEHLGLLAAVTGYCREFAAQQKLVIDFSHDSITAAVSQEVSLTLFRILQESLHNAVKYSGVRHFNVELGCNSNEIFLRVADSGVGFDPELERHRRGLGLVSMKERARLVNGSLTIHTKPGEGTSIHARVPISETDYPDDEGGRSSFDEVRKIEKAS